MVRKSWFIVQRLAFKKTEHLSVSSPLKKSINITEGPTNCGRVSPEVVSLGLKSIRPMTNSTLQHVFNIRDIFS